MTSGNQPRVVGLDIGGSKTQALAAGPGDSSAVEVLAGSANLSSVGAAEVTRQLTVIFDGIGRDGVTAVCAGAAGVDTPEQERRLHDLIGLQVPQAVVRVVHDTELILAAAELDHGIALISGTGSVCWGRSSYGLTARAGGWGYLLGDEGSGYWIGRQAVRHVLAMLDSGARLDLLTQRLTTACGLRSAGELLDHFYAHPERRYWAGRSAVVFELAADGDPAATRIVQAAAAALAALVGSVSGNLGLKGPVVLGGGLLMHQPMLASGVRNQLSGNGFTGIRVLEHDPVHGALALAGRLSTGH